MECTRIVLPGKPLSNEQWRNNGAQRRKPKLIHTCIYIYVHVLHASFHWHRDSPPRSAWTGLKRGPTHDSCVQATKETRGRRTEDEEEWTWLDRAREKQLPRTPTPSASLIFHILPPYRRPIFKPMPPPPLPPLSLLRGGKKPLGKRTGRGTPQPTSSTLPDLSNAYRFLLRYLFPPLPAPASSSLA